ncbi:hypothetical protein F4777DRAFT_133600 [Nemania sp. FL0916]|nr:hypothetical protein F4777DRAFT_133600 [Nemania sp. FL0916]
MYSTRWIQILMVALSILIATQASWFHHGLEARQSAGVAIDAGGPADASDTPDLPPPTSSGDDSSTPTDSSSSSEPTDPPTSSSDPPSSTSEDPTTTPTPSSSADDTTTSDQPPSSTTPSDSGPITTPPTPTPTPTKSTTSSAGGDSNTDTPHDTETSETQKPTTITKTAYYTSTDASGQTHVGSSEAVVTSTPGFSGGSGSKGNNSGLSTTAKNTIIGVTVGVGGAIILAAAGILYWRLRNKRRSQEENEELISYGAGFGGPGTAEKSEASGPSTGPRSPFQSTLETYHAPTQTNAASNF